MGASHGRLPSESPVGGVHRLPSLEQHLGKDLKPDHPIMAWMILHAGTIYNLFHRGVPHDGLTAYQRLRGKEWKVSIPPFGETVEFMRKTYHKLERRWEPGVFLGVRESTTEKIVGTATGVLAVQSIRRKPEGERCDSSLVDTVVGVPWDPNPQGRKGRVALEQLPAPVQLPPSNPDAPREPTAPAEGVVIRQHYIVKADLVRWGCTLGCPARDVVRTGEGQAIRCASHSSVS